MFFEVNLENGNSSRSHAGYPGGLSKREGPDCIQFLYHLVGKAWESVVDHVQGKKGSFEFFEPGDLFLLPFDIAVVFYLQFDLIFKRQVVKVNLEIKISLVYESG